MFGKFFNTLATPFTTATGVGVTVRYASTAVGSMLAIVALMGWLSPEQAEELGRLVPELIGAIGALVATVVPIYAVWTKSSSNKAAEVAKEVDAKVPIAQDVKIKIEGSGPNILVKGE